MQIDCKYMITEYQIRKEVLGLKDLHPCEEVNAVMSRLTTYCCDQSHMNSSSTTNQIEMTRAKSAIAEVELEKHWSKIFLASQIKLPNLQDFIYYSNYNDLTDLEYANIKLYKNKINNALFIGGGALPLTAIILANKFDIKVTILEIDNSSYELSQKLITKLGLENKIQIINVNAHNYNYYGDYDVIYLAAMVGDGQVQKDNLINIIANQVHTETILLVRSAFGMKELLYSPYYFKSNPNFKLLSEIRPHNHIVNSFYVLQKT